MLSFDVMLLCASAISARVSRLSRPGPDPASGPSSSGSPLLERTTSLSLLSPQSKSVAGLWNETFVSTLNVSAGPRLMPPLPPLPPTWYTCSGTTLGFDLNPSSCLQARTLISRIERELSFGPRNIEPPIPPGYIARPDVGLPKRYLSCRRSKYQQYRILRC